MDRATAKSVKVTGDDGKDVAIDVDFERIDGQLIQEALTKNGLTGETTGVIAQAGNIRLDVFQMLIAYDLVMADISIHNANVLGPSATCGPGRHEIGT